MKKLIAAFAVASCCAPPMAFAGEGLAGLYAGGALGYGAPSMTVEDSDCWYNCSAYTQRPTGVTYGVQVGQNFVNKGFIYGWEIDYTAAGLDETFEYGYYTGPNDDMQIKSEFKSALSARGKAGLLIDKTALVLSFGLAQGTFESLFADRNNSTDQSTWDVASNDDSVSGHVFGAAVEHAITDKLIVSGSLSQYSFDTEDDTVTAAGGTETGSKVNYVNSVDSFRIGLSYKFF